jgi:hypothetical protein
MKECPYCNTQIDGKHAIYANHIRWCKENPNYNKINKNNNISEGVKKQLNRDLGEYKEFDVKCFNCKKIFQVKEREKQFPKKEKYFCDRSCANTRYHNKETKRRISKTTSISIKKLWKEPSYVHKTLNAENSIFVSKGEREIREYFQKNFPNDNWTFGGNLRYNNFPLVRDLYSNKLKVCIEYDGIWHFEDIHGQLDYKQKQDLALEQWCINNNYRLIRIKEDIYLTNKEYWIDTLVDEVYRGVGRIVKFY